MEGFGGNTNSQNRTHAATPSQNFPVMVMGLHYASAGYLSKLESLYEYLLDKHTFYSFASPSSAFAPLVELVGS